MTTPLFRLQLGWRSYLMTAADAAKVMDLLARADCVESGWINSKHILIDATREDLTLSVASSPRMGRDAYDTAREAEKVAEAVAALAAAEVSQ